MIVYARGNSLDAGESSVQWGADIARYGGDKTCLAKRQGPVILDFKEKGQLSTIDSAAWIELEVGGANVAIDEIGVGGGVLDALLAKDTACQPTGINVSKSASDAEKFLNLRAELSWKLRTRFEKGEIDLSRLSQDTYDKLKTQLSGIGYRFSKGKLQVEAKEDMKRRGLASPDLADALILSFSVDDTGRGNFDWKANDLLPEMTTAGADWQQYGGQDMTQNGGW